MARKNERKKVANVRKPTMIKKVPKGPPTSVKPGLKPKQMVKTVEEEKLHLCDPELLKDVLKFYSECLIISRMINENKKARDEDRKDNGTTTASLALRQEQQRLSVMKRTNVTEPEKVFRQRIKAAQARRWKQEAVGSHVVRVDGKGSRLLPQDCNKLGTVINFGR